MKEEVLRLLCRHPREFLSGEEISRVLAISRTAVWKHIQTLRAEGYRIASLPRKGYCLEEFPDALYPEVIRAGWQPGSLGQLIHHYPEVESTNLVARERAEQGAPEGTVVVAEAQRGGRGRLGRTWASPPGRGIWLSLVLRPQLSPAVVPQITLLAAVAVSRAIARSCGLQAGIKWPNDLLLEGRKVCGILTEMKAELDMVHYVVLGVGLNVNLTREDFPPGVASRATSLCLTLGRQVERVPLVRALLEELESLYVLFLTKGFDPVAAAWREHSVTLGQWVTISSPGRNFTGRALDLAGDGALLVEGAEGEQRLFYAGDVTLRAENSDCLDQPTDL